jgi:sterol desaturase/sphingolipid hydroxylase (fatty acid hydroxylase superfamily)
MYLAVAFFILLAAAELLLIRREPVYELGESEISLAMAAGWFSLLVLVPGTALWLPRALHIPPLISVPQGIGGLLILILVGDFVMYWSHRASHTFRWQWAADQAHHTSTRLNVLAAFRQGWTDLPAGLWLYWIPLGFVGFSSWQWSAFFLISTAWAAVTHNEWAPRLGVLELVFVTPSHHRVHHDVSAGPRAHNYGNILILWDRIFGTFNPEGDVRMTRFGVSGKPFDGVLDVAFREWRVLFLGWHRRLLCVLQSDRT